MDLRLTEILHDMFESKMIDEHYLRNLLDTHKINLDEYLEIIKTN